MTCIRGGIVTDRYHIKKYNLLEMLDDEINKHSSWSSKEKADYIYIRMCQLFNYDERWRYTESEKLRGKIFDKMIDVTNVNTSKTVCSGFSNAFADIINILLSGCKDFDTILTYGEESHMYTSAWFNDIVCTYDPILFTNDFLNAKKSLPILGIKINNLDIWEEELVQEDSFKRIGYSKSGVEKLKNIRKKANINSDSYESFFDYLINNLDFNNLGIYEANNLLNMQAKAQYQKNFNSLGIDLNYQETNDNGIVFTYSYNNKDRYEVSEDSGKIKVLKL